MANAIVSTGRHELPLIGVVQPLPVCEMIVPRLRTTQCEAIICNSSGSGTPASHTGLQIREGLARPH